MARTALQRVCLVQGHVQLVGQVLDVASLKTHSEKQRTREATHMQYTLDIGLVSRPQATRKVELSEDRQQIQHDRQLQHIVAV